MGTGKQVVTWPVTVGQKVNFTHAQLRTLQHHLPSSATYSDTRWLPVQWSVHCKRWQQGRDVLGALCWYGWALIQEGWWMAMVPMESPSSSKPQMYYLSVVPGTTGQRREPIRGPTRQETTSKLCRRCPCGFVFEFCPNLHPLVQVKSSCF